MNRRFRLPRLRYSLALLFVIALPVAIVSIWFSTTRNWHLFRAAELAKLSSDKNASPEFGYLVVHDTKPVTKTLPERWLDLELLPPVEQIRSRAFRNERMEPEHAALLKNDHSPRGFDFRAVPELQTLYIATTSPLFQPATVKHLANLEEFNYYDVASLYSDYLRDEMLPEYLAAFPTMPRLKTFDAENDFRFIEGRWLPILIEKTPNLENLSLSLCQLNSAAIQAVAAAKTWKIVKLKLWEAQPELYWDFVEAVLRQPLYHLSIDNYPDNTTHLSESLYHGDPEFETKNPSAEYAAFKRFQETLETSPRRFTLRDSSLSHLELNRLPNLLIERCRELQTLIFETYAKQLEIRDCPRLDYIDCDAEQVTVKNCPALGTLICHVPKLIELEGTTKIDTLDLYRFEQIKLRGECPGFRNLKILCFNREPDSAFDIPLIPSLERVELQCLNDGLLTSLARQTNPLEIHLALPFGNDTELCTAENFSRFLKTVPIRRLHLKRLGESPLQREYLKLLDQAPALEELHIELITDLLPLGGKSFAQPDKAFLKLPTTLKKIVVKKRIVGSSKEEEETVRKARSSQTPLTITYGND